MEAVAKPISVLLVDDHQTMLWGLVKLIESRSSVMAVAGTARTCRDTVAKCREIRPDVVLLDLDLGGESAMDILPTLQLEPSLHILVFTGERDQSKLDWTMLHGAHGIVSKDSLAEHLLTAIEKVAAGEIWLDNKSLRRVFGHLSEPAATSKSPVNADRLIQLTSRERKIVQAVVAGSGADNRQLAESLFISEHTLRNHLTSIYHKLGVGNRLELYVYAVKHPM